MNSHRITEKNSSELVKKGLKRRYRAERRFRLMGMAALFISVVVVVILFGSIISRGYSAFFQWKVKLNVFLDPASMNVDNLATADYGGIIKAALRREFPEIKRRKEKRLLYHITSVGAAYQLRDMVMRDSSLVGSTVSFWAPLDDDVDMYLKGVYGNSAGRLKPLQIRIVQKLQEEGRIKKTFNTTFFTAGDSRDPELAGIRGAVTGSFYTLLVTLLLSFPIGVAAAVYLEEFARPGTWSDIIEVNINNLAAVPSIIFGLLGLAIFLNLFGLPRSSPLVGGLVLTLMTLPTIIIASRAALKSVPPSIREAALVVGASKMQTVFHHVLPLALPGMLTGTIIGMAQALGETAPLLMIGMVAFVADIPQGITDPSAVLPVQIYLWADSPERAFMEKTSAAIIVLLAFLVVMNGTAVCLRKRFERKW